MGPMRWKEDANRNLHPRPKQIILGLKSDCPRPRGQPLLTANITEHLHEPGPGGDSGHTLSPVTLQEWSDRTHL